MQLHTRNVNMCENFRALDSATIDQICPINVHHQYVISGNPCGPAIGMQSNLGWPKIERTLCKHAHAFLDFPNGSFVNNWQFPSNATWCLKAYSLQACACIWTSPIVPIRLLLPWLAFSNTTPRLCQPLQLWFFSYVWLFSYLKNYS